MEPKETNHECVQGQRYCVIPPTNLAVIKLHDIVESQRAFEKVSCLLFFFERAVGNAELLQLGLVDDLKKLFSSLSNELKIECFRTLLARRDKCSKSSTATSGSCLMGRYALLNLWLITTYEFLSRVYYTCETQKAPENNSKNNCHLNKFQQINYCCLIRSARG